MSKKPITVYWSPAFNIDQNDNDWSLLYLKPKSLYKEIQETRIDSAPAGNLLACPAFSNKYKNTYVFRSSQPCHYEYDYENNKHSINTLEPRSYRIWSSREQSFSFGPMFGFAFYNIFFADEPLTASFTPPYYHEPKYTKHGSVIPGEFDIGQWFRPFNAEIQAWNNKGQIIIEEEEPLFYVEFKTNRPIIFKQFLLNDQLAKYAKLCVTSHQTTGFGKSLLYKYNRFNKIGLREKILFEIKNNTID
jgi:hypothetical protein